MFNLEKFLNELKDEQIKKLEALNQKVDMNSDPKKNEDINKDTNEKPTSAPKTVVCSSSCKFPISYLENKNEINDNIINDLELVESKDPEGLSMYNHIFKPESIFSKKFH